MFSQELLRLIAALSHALTVDAEPSDRLLNQLIFRREIEKVTFVRNPFAIHEVELDLAKWRRHFIFHDLYGCAVTDDIFAVFNRADATDIETNARIELQRVTTSSSFRVTEHHTNLHTNLVDENNHRLTTADSCCEFAQRLRHQ